MENKVRKIKLTKLRDSDHPGEINNIFAGESRVGVMSFGDPKVGECFFLEKRNGSFFRTSTVQEILSPNSFRTYNSIYQYEDVVD